MDERGLVRLLYFLLFIFISGNGFAQDASEKHYKTGMELALKKKYKLAKIEFRKALKENPQHNDAQDSISVINDLNTLKGE